MVLQRFLLAQALGGGVINAVLNGAPAFVLMTADTRWHLWKSFPSLVLDTCGMAFGIAFGTGWLLTLSLRKQIAAGKVVVPPAGAFSARVRKDFGNWPAHAFHRGVNLGGLAVLGMALPVIGVMFATGVESWDRWPVFLFKTVFGFVVGAVFTPLVAVGVAVEPPQPAPSLVQQGEP